MKKYLLMLCCAVVYAGFVGCSDNDDEGVNVSVESLAGRWSCYQEDDWYGGELDKDDEFGDGVDLYILEFNTDGTGGQFEGIYLSELGNENNWDRFTYTLKGSQLSMRHDGNVDECRVSKITSSELVLVYEGMDEGVKYTEKFYFHRMK